MSPDRSAPEAPSGSSASPLQRIAVSALTAALLGVSIFLVRYPPVLDLAQQVAQIPLIDRALGESSPLYEIQWLAPNRLSYPLLGLGWIVGGATWGPRLGLALCLAAAIVSVHWLAARFDRPPLAAAVASIFLVSSAYYGGFFNFVLGGLPLALWLSELSRSAAGEKERWPIVSARTVGISLVFYWTHLLWLAAAAGLLLLFILLRPAARGMLALRLVAMTPIVAAATAWQLSTRHAEGARNIDWGTPIYEWIFSPKEWVTHFLGGLRGATEAWIVALVLLICGLVLVASRFEGAHRLEPTLALAAAAFLVAGVALPEFVDTTWMFGRRFLPWAAICFVLSLPSPRIGRRPRELLSITAVVLFAALTTRAWIGFDREEMRGFDQALAALPENSSLLALDFNRYSPRFWVYPTQQMGAYAELERNAEPAFSFAEHRSSLVVYRELPRQVPWTAKLDQLPSRLRAEDLRHFDFALMHLKPQFSALVPARFPDLEPVAGADSWWLFRVNGENSRP